MLGAGGPGPSQAVESDAWFFYSINVCGGGEGVAAVTESLVQGELPLMLRPRERVHAELCAACQGITGQEAVGQILAGGVRDMSAWVNKLYGQAFAAVYVQPGAKVAVHLEKPLAIDFDPEGRKVDHRAGESHALELD